MCESVIGLKFEFKERVAAHSRHPTLSQHQRQAAMDPKKAVKDLVLEAFQDEEVQEMFGNLKANCKQREGVTDDNLRDLLLDLVVESYMLSSSRQNVALEPDMAGRSCHGLEASSNNDDRYTVTETGKLSQVHLQPQGVHNTNVSNNTQQNLTTPNLPSACHDVSKENAEITHVHDSNDGREASSCESYPHTTSTEGNLYKRVLSALRLAKKENVTSNVTSNDDNSPIGYNTYEHIPCDPHKTMPDHDAKLRRVWMRLSDSASDDTSQGDELTTAGVEIDANLTTPQETSVDESKGPISEEEPSLLYKTFLTEAQETMGDQNLIREIDGESNLDEYESASDNDTELESWHSNENISLSRASSSSFLTASDYLEEVFADPGEDVVLTKTIRPQFLGNYYLQRLVNARQTATEIKARKPEPRVKLDKPCRLDTNLTYAVRQSLKRSLPLIAGKNKLSALMVMADGMFDEMSLDRDLDDLAWPFDPLAELRESGLAMVDYMDPHPADSATINTSDMKDQSSPSGSVPCSATVQDVSDLNSGNPENNKEDDLVETLKLADSLNLTPIASSGQPANVSVSDAVATGPLVLSSPKLATVSTVSKESFQTEKSLRFLFKPLKAVVDSFFNRDPFRVLVNQIQSSPTYEISKIKLLPSGYESMRQTSLVPLSDGPYKLHISVPDETDFNNANAISGYPNNEARLPDCSDDTYKSKKLSQSLDLVREIRPQFLGKFYLKRLANARQTAAEIKARKPESRVKVEKPCRLDTNLTYAVHQSLKRSLPLVASKNKLSALMVMADGMFDEMSLDRDLHDLAWPYDPLAKLRASGLAMIDYVRPCSSDDLLRTTAPIDTKDEITPVEISSSSIDKNLLPEDSESKDVDMSDIERCPSQLHQAKVETPEEHWSPRTYLQSTSFDQEVARRTPCFKYSPVTSSPRTDKILRDNFSENHQDCLAPVECGQISLSSRDFIRRDDVTSGMLPLEKTPPMRKEDDHQSVDSALGEETSETSLDKDDVESEVMTTCTQAKIQLHDSEEGLEVLFKSFSSPSTGENEVLPPNVEGMVSSNVQLFEQLALDGREGSLKSSKLANREIPNMTTICKAIKKRALAFENVGICRPPNAKQTLHNTEDDGFHTVNIKAQVAMFEKLSNANTSW